MESNQPQQPAGIPASMRRSATGGHPPKAPSHHQAPFAPRRRRNNVGKWIGLAILAVLVLAIAFFIFRVATGKYNELSVKPSAYQAVFLNNNMVYFGKLSQVDGDYVKLTDIYYLQVQNQQGQQQAQQDQSQQQLSLAKLGGEIHGPEDTMYISRQEIMFWENLKADGKVAQAIKDYQSKNKQ